MTDAYQERDIQLATGSVHLLEGGAGRTIVFLHHSWGSPGWLPVHESLAASHRVVVPDLPGWGGSERPAWAREPRDLAILAGRILEALDAESATLIGAGFGGFVAAELATMRPLESLVLIGAAGIQPEDGEILDQMLVSHRAYIEAGFRDRDAYVAWVGEEPADDVRQLWDFSREMTARVCWKPYMSAPQGSTGASYRSSATSRRRRSRYGAAKTGSCRRSAPRSTPGPCRTAGSRPSRGPGTSSRSRQRSGSPD